MSYMSKKLCLFHASNLSMIHSKLSNYSAHVSGVSMSVSQLTGVSSGGCDRGGLLLAAGRRGGSAGSCTGSRCVSGTTPPCRSCSSRRPPVCRTRRPSCSRTSAGPTGRSVPPVTARSVSVPVTGVMVLSLT